MKRLAELQRDLERAGAAAALPLICAVLAQIPSARRELACYCADPAMRRAVEAFIEGMRAIGNRDRQRAEAAEL